MGNRMSQVMKGILILSVWKKLVDISNEQSSVSAKVWRLTNRLFQMLKSTKPREKILENSGMENGFRCYLERLQMATKLNKHSTCRHLEEKWVITRKPQWLTKSYSHVGLALLSAKELLLTGARWCCKKKSIISVKGEKVAFSLIFILPRRCLSDRKYLIHF